MSHKCPICNNDFSSLEQFDIHIEQHKEESILDSAENSVSQNIEIIDHNGNLNNSKITLDKIFDKEKFEKLTQNKIESVENIEEIILRRKFVEQVKKIHRKNPFCYVPYFVKKFLNGNPSNELQELFHFPNSLELYNVIKNILEFKQDRYRQAQYNNAFELNLKIPGWKEKYELFEENFSYFENELNELFFENILQSFIILILMDKPLTKEELFEKCFELKNSYDVYYFIDKKLGEKFNSFFNSELKNRFEEILFELISQKVIHVIHSDVKRLKITLTIDEIKKSIKNLLQVYHGKLTFGSLKTQINQENPSLKLTSGMGIFEVAIHELENENYVHLERRSHRKNDYEVFLSEDFTKLENNVKNLENMGYLPFKGRKISPETFVSELLELEKGDFNDADDQVTRIAGLVLAESVTLQSPHEDISEFDFAINIKNYNFRPEQISAMEKLNFKIISETLHVKVMIDEIITLKKYHELLEKIPEKEQGVIVTFEKIPSNVKKLLENDPTIQIIDEEGIKVWVSISSRLPARVNSVSKISFDPLSHLENNIVKVNSVLYEKGIALVITLPDLKEIPVLVRSLEEVEFAGSSPNNFTTYSENYFEFLKNLRTMTTKNTFFEGIFKNTFEENPKNTKKLFRFNFNHAQTMWNLSGFDKASSFNCTCFNYIENPLKLCSHLVTTLDNVVKRYSYLDSWDGEYSILRNSLRKFLQDSISTILDRLTLDETVENKADLANFIVGLAKIKQNN